MTMFLNIQYQKLAPAAVVWLKLSKDRFNSKINMVMNYDKETKIILIILLFTFHFAE